MQNLIYRKRDYSEITTNFDPEKEAIAFFRLFLRNKLTLEQTKTDILMTPEQRDWLLQENLASKTSILLMYQKREAAYAWFLRFFKTQKMPKNAPAAIPGVANHGREPENTL